MLYFLPLYFQAVDNVEATQAGVRLLPGIIGGILGSLFSGALMQWTGTFYVLTIAGYAILTAGLVPILLFTGVPGANTWDIHIGLAACGFGNGIGLTTSMIGLIASVTPQDQAVATACLFLFRSLGAAVGLSLSTTVAQLSLRALLGERLGSGLDADTIAEGVRLSLNYINHLSPELQKIVRDCYGIALRAGFSLMLGFGIKAIMSSGKCTSV